MNLERDDKLPVVEATLADQGNQLPEEVVASSEASSEQERLRDKFKSVARLGRDVLTETDTRKKRLLASFLDSRQFFAEDKRSLASHQGEYSEEDIEEAKRASFAISLQAASQIEEASIRQTPRALKKDIVRDEITSLQKMDFLYIYTSWLEPRIDWWRFYLNKT